MWSMTTEGIKGIEGMAQAQDSAQDCPTCPQLTANGAIGLYSQESQAQDWLTSVEGLTPTFVCVAGFTATALIENISAAGLTPQDRLFTANADLEFLLHGVQSAPRDPLPPLTAGASPVLISRAITTACQFPIYAINAGLPYPLPAPAFNLNLPPARCVSTGQSLPIAQVWELFRQGWTIGQTLAPTAECLIISECVVGGTTTALGVLTGLGIAAAGKVNSSHAQCNHQLKQAVVEAGLQVLQRRGAHVPLDPIAAIATFGDPMQPVVAGLALAASRQRPVLLAGGTQMLAVWEVSRRLATHLTLATSDKSPLEPLIASFVEPQEFAKICLERILVGTTRWVAEDPTGGTIALAQQLHAPLVATQLNFAHSRHHQLRAYERGYVKEGVGAGGCAIAAIACQAQTLAQLVTAIDQLVDQLVNSST